jgi:hypothetical protein
MMRFQTVWRGMSYRDIVLTIIAALLALNIAGNLGLLGFRAAHADAPTPVVIVGPTTSPNGYLPVAIMSPIAFNGSVCANPCR